MGVLTRSGCPKPEMLLAYQDNALTDEEDRRVADHLRLCDRCREYLTTSREIGVLLRRHSPIIDDPEGLAELKRRLREPPPPPRPIGHHFARVRMVALCVGLVALLGVGLVATGTVEGGSSFTRWFSEGSSLQRVRSDGPGAGTPLVAPPVVRGEPVLLPLGLVRVGGIGSAGDRLYRSEDGLAISVVVEQEGDSRIYTDDNAVATGVIGLDGQEVYVSYDETVAGQAIVVFHWIADEHLVSVLVLEQPVGGLQVDGVAEIVSALMAGSGE